MISKYKIVLYSAVNTANGKRYIGITNVGLRKREQRHRYNARSGYGSIIGAALRKYGPGIRFSVLAVCPDLAYAKQMEIAAISAFRPEYNCTEGGDGCRGYRHTEEHKAYIKNKMKSICARPWLGKSPSEETRRRMAEARSRYWEAKVRPKKERKPRSMIRGAVLRFKQVECLSTGEVFNSIIAASRHTGCDRKSIRNVCNGVNRTAGGLSFQYLAA